MEIEVAFTEKLERSTCANLLVESVKFLMFHRYQMPLPFQQLKAEDERQLHPRRSPRNRPLPSVLKKQRQLLADMEELLLNIHQSFLESDILEVLLLFGATVVNPKEMYSIKICNFSKTSDSDRMKAVCALGKENGFSIRSKFVDKCCRKLARTLFTDSALNGQGELGCTSVHCFVLAPRCMSTTWFRPKVSFRVPKKGKLCVIKLLSGDDEGELGASNGCESDFGISSGNEDQVKISEANHSEQDTLWFQAPVVIKGYKEPYKETTDSSVWKK